MMKFFTGWLLAAGLALATTAAQAQVPAPYEAGRAPYYSVSDIGDPYYAPPRYAPQQYPGPAQYPGPRYGYGQGPMLLPPTEVYTVVRESGFSPLGIPQQRGFVYTISVIDRGGDDGRLIIDARTGRIIRFIPAHRMGDNFNDDLTMNYGPPGPLPPTAMSGARRGRRSRSRMSQAARCRCRSRARSPLPSRPAPNRRPNRGRQAGGGRACGQTRRRSGAGPATTGAAISRSAIERQLSRNRLKRKRRRPRP